MKPKKRCFKPDNKPIQNREWDKTKKDWIEYSTLIEELGKRDANEMREYKIEIYCAENLAEKGIEVFNYIAEMLEKEYSEEEYIMFGCYVKDDIKEVTK